MRRRLLKIAAAALVLALALAGAAAMGLLDRLIPPIHDVTTDTADPPAFVALLAAREAAPNGAAYGGAAVAAIQAAAYPDVAPLRLPVPPAAAFERALAAARAMGWTIAAADAGAGRIEASDRTPVFRFVDDVVVRIRPDGAGSRIDVRSVSRLGLSDLGKNAARIRAYLAAVRA